MGIVLPEVVAVGIYNSQITQKRSVTSNRKTTMFEIELPIEDSGTSYIDSEHRLITQNVVICAKAGQTRHTRLPFKCYYIHMILNDGELFDTLMSLPNFIEFSNTDKVRRIFEKMCVYYERGTSESRIMLQSLLLELVYILDKNASSSKKSHNAKNNNHKIIEQTIDYIKNNLTADLSLEKLAENASFSTIYFHKLFKTSTGKTLHEYIEEQRIKKSINLLVSTNMTLSQIAYECGFSSQSYFSYAFKRNMGITPRAYAKKIAELYNE